MRRNVGKSPCYLASVALHVYSDFIINDIEAIASLTSSKKKNVLLFLYHILKSRDWKTFERCKNN